MTHCTCNKPCPKCDPSIEAYYQMRVKEAGTYADNLEAKWVWADYCALRDAEAADDAADESITPETDLSGW